MSNSTHWPDSTVGISPPGHDAPVQPGDFILCHRRGLASSIIRLGERLRFHSRDAFWSHAALVENEYTVIEALTRSVQRTPLDHYRDITYVHVSAITFNIDRAQAVAFGKSCIGQEYGWLVILGVALRFLTPGRGLWFGMNGTEICSGLVAQAMCRGWANYPVNPGGISPTELAHYYKGQNVWHKK